MYLLLNRDEVVSSLAKRMLTRRAKQINIKWTNTDEYIEKCSLRQKKSGLICVDFNTVNSLLIQDLQIYKDSIVSNYKTNYRALVNWLVKNYDRLNIDSATLIKSHVEGKQNSKNFVKTFGQQLCNELTYVVAGQPVPDEQNVVVRNIMNNEMLLCDRLRRNLPFWFIDSGYTNFLTGKKTWHRVVANNLHYNTLSGYFPADRLAQLPMMPAPWRKQGTRIVIICSSDHHHLVHGTTQELWQDQVKKQIRQFTDLPMEWRKKQLSRKTRTSVYDDLKNDKDVYCVISDSSAAAIEAIWLGIPVITLNRHISSAVSRQHISEINDLYRGPLGDWLCALTYSQFTEKEIHNGTALKIIKKYHA